MIEDKEYENCLDIKIQEESNLLDFMELNDTEYELLNTDKEWKKHWKGMPEFQTEDSSYRKLVVNFKCKEDFDSFESLIGIKMTNKTKSIWFPKLNLEPPSMFEWVVDD